MGVEFSGSIVALGPGVSDHWHESDQVMGLAGGVIYMLIF
jgi:NADPH:quinone reductase-like Zn-dependent oxidoreductase